jgi:hypothetical protein
MKAKKRVLIVTDGTDQVGKMADGIAAALKGNTITIKAASEFTGTELLSADIFFIGCEAPAPASFSYLSDLLKHINLAGRSCGIFSPRSETAVSYLTGLLKDSEAALNPKPLFAATAGVSAWAKTVLQKN